MSHPPRTPVPHGAELPVTTTADNHAPAATDTPVGIIIGAACVHCRRRFTVSEALASVPAPEAGFPAARRHEECLPPTEERPTCP